MRQGNRLLALVVVLAAGCCATPAYAGQIVFEHGSEIWAMNEDGSGQHAIASAFQIPTTISLDSPAANAAGDVTFSAKWIDGEAERQHWSPPGPAGACGVYCVGLYKLTGGVASRLSPAPYGCPLNPCLQSEDDGEFVGPGPVYYSHFFANAGNRGCGSWCIDTTSDQIHFRSLDGGGETNFNAYCDGATDPTPKPDGSGVIAYVGCQADPGGGAAPAVIVSGANGANATAISFDDVTQRDPSWSPDGGLVLTAEGGADAGVWTTNLAGTQFRQVVAADSVSSPRFIGAGAIGYVYNGDIWKVPASCNACAPTSGTKLTNGDAGAFAWTPAIAITALGAGGGGGPGGPGGASGGGTPGQAGENSGTVFLPVITSLKALAKTVRAAKGFRFRIVLARKATVAVTVIGKKRLGTVKFKGKRGKNTFTVRRVHRRLLKPGKYKARIKVASDAVRTLRFKVRR